MGAASLATPTAALPLALAIGPHHPNPAVAALFKPSSRRRPPPARPPPANPRLHYAACWRATTTTPRVRWRRARDAEAFKGG